MSKRYSEEFILKVLNENKKGKSVLDLTREYGFHKLTFYEWKKKYAGLESSELRRLKGLEKENERLKKIVADLSLEKTMLEDVLSKKW